MMGFILSKAAEGDAESIKTLATLRELGFSGRNVLDPKSQQEIEKELEIWQVLDMCVAGYKEHKKRNYFNKLPHSTK